MTCSNCRVFTGTPICACCQSFFRIGNLLKEGRLCGYQEGPALAALRNCAGALLDLTEGSSGTPFGPSGEATTPGRSPEIGSWPLESGVKEKSEKTKAEGGEDPAKKGKPSVKEKRKLRRREPKKSKKRTSPSPTASKAAHKKSKEREESGGRSPERSVSEEDRPEIRRKKKSESYRGGTERGRDPEGSEDREAEAARLGLSTIPVRGSAGKFIPAVSRNSSHDRPPEPAGPPPQKTRSEYEEYQDYITKKRKEQGGRPQREKGFNHWKRGRDHWKAR